MRLLLRRDGEPLGAESEVGLRWEEEVGDDGFKMGASGCGVDVEIGTGRGVVAPEERPARDSFVEEAEEEEFCEVEEPEEYRDLRETRREKRSRRVILIVVVWSIVDQGFRVFSSWLGPRFL